MAKFINIDNLEGKNYILNSDQIVAIKDNGIHECTIYMNSLDEEKKQLIIKSSKKPDEILAIINGE